MERRSPCPRSLGKFTAREYSLAMRHLLRIPLALVFFLGCGENDPDESGTRADASSQSSEDGAPSGGADARVPSQVGGPCETANDCSDPPDAECFTDQGAQFGIVYPGGYCSKSCRMEEGEPEVDCGTGMCVTTGSSGGGTSVSQAFCAKPCDSNDECRTAEGYRCHQLPFNLGGYCAP